MNQLLLGDNLQILRTLPDNTIDLIYLDPPFFSNRTYEVIWGDTGEVRSFEDRFSGGIDHYIAWLKERVQEMHRILKPTGSIFLHCDWHANAYIRVFILDKIFGANNFRGEIIWQRTNAHNDAKRKLGVLTDTIWYYSKTDNFTYNPIYQKLSKDNENDLYKMEDENGRYTSSDLTGSGIRTGEFSVEWKGYKPTEKNRHWAISVKAIEELVGIDKAKELTTIQKLELLKDNNLILFTSNGTPRFKRYLDTSKGTLLGNFWTDINNVGSQAKERIGYPTQKPIALLQRIIEMASHEGDTILDPFVGGGTTVAVADKLNRNWIGIDQSVAAVKVTEMRLHNQQDLFSKPFTTRLHKYDYDTLRYKDAFEFETFIITAYGGKPQNKKGGDMGIDGVVDRVLEPYLTKIPIQVKRSDNIGRNVIDNFLAAIQRHDQTLYNNKISTNQTCGIIIAFSFSKGAIQEVARLQNELGVIIELVRVETIIPIAKKPALTVTLDDKGKNAKNLHEIEFTATGTSDAGIEFYAWNWDYKPDTGFKADIMIDKTGKQTHTFKAGKHAIMVKVIDNEGLESTELIHLNINGNAHRIV